MIIHPSESLAQHLAEQNVPKQDGYEVFDSDYMITKAQLRYAHPTDSPDELKDRVDYFLIWKHFGVQANDGTRGAELQNAQKVGVLTEEFKKMNVSHGEHLPAIRDEVRLSSDSLCAALHGLSVDLRESQAKEAGNLKEAIEQSETTRSNIAVAFADAFDFTFGRILKGFYLVVGLLACIFLALVVLTAFAYKAHAQYTNTNIVKFSGDNQFWDSTNHALKVNVVAGGAGGGVVTQPTGTNLHMVCDSGCGGAASYTDASAFTFGTTAVNNISAVVDDVGTNTVAENSAGAVRMGSDRILFVKFSTAQPITLTSTTITGSVAVTGPLTDTQLRASAVPVSIATAPVLVAGAAIIGKVGIDQTTPGTTNAVSATNLPTTVDTNSGVKSASTLRVVLATDQPALTNKLLVTPDSVALPANQSVNVNQINSVTPLMGTGLTGTGSLRVTIATDQAQLTNKLLVTPDSVALPANQSVNVSQINAVTPLMGNGVTGTGSPRVTLASDGTAISTTGYMSVKIDQTTPGTTNGVRSDASGATGAAPPARAELNGFIGSGATGGFTTGAAVGDTYKNISVSTATTTLLVTGVSGRQVRISALHMITAAANNVALIEGTGATCGTGSAGMAGGTTAASGYNLAANGGIAFGSGLGTVMQTATTGDSVCVVTSAATQLSGGLQYTIY
jgi:hypothetical protein